MCARCVRELLTAVTRDLGYLAAMKSDQLPQPHPSSSTCVRVCGRARARVVGRGRGGRRGERGGEWQAAGGPWRAP